MVINGHQQEADHRPQIGSVCVVDRRSQVTVRCRAQTPVLSSPLSSSPHRAQCSCVFVRVANRHRCALLVRACAMERLTAVFFSLSFTSTLDLYTATRQRQQNKATGMSQCAQVIAKLLQFNTCIIKSTTTTMFVSKMFFGYYPGKKGGGGGPHDFKKYKT